MMGSQASRCLRRMRCFALLCGSSGQIVASIDAMQARQLNQDLLELGYRRKFTPKTAIETPASGLRSGPAPLFVEECYALSLTDIAQLSNPRERRRFWNPTPRRLRYQCALGRTANNGAGPLR